MRKRIALIQSTLGMVNRGNESYCIEMSEALKKYYDIEVYSRGVAPELQSFTIQVDFTYTYILRLYEKIFSKSIFLHKISDCSRWTYFLKPTYIIDYKWTKKVYKKYLCKKKYDLLLPANGIAGCYFAQKYRKRTGVPFCYKGGGGIGAGDWWVLKTKPDSYISVSSAQQCWAAKVWKNTVMIPNGTYLEKFSDYMVEEKYVINENHKLVVCCGHLDMDFKRHQLAIKAVSKLENVDLLLLGSGEAEKEFYRLGNELMPGRLQIKAVSHSEIPFYFKSADVFTLPSKGEPFGIVYIEAMAAGLPCVATDDEIRREIIGDAGILCDVENIDEYAEKLKKVMEINWGDLPYKKAMQYDYSIIGEKYHHLIEKLTEK